MKASKHPLIDLAAVIERLEADPNLAVYVVAQEIGVHKSVLGRHLQKAGREDLVTRYAKKRASQTASKYRKMLLLLDNDPELIVIHAAEKVGLHWNGTHVRKNLTQLDREDLLLRITPTEYKVTKNVERLQKLLDADPDLSIKQASAKLGMCQEVAARQLRARGFEKYINRKQKRAKRSRDVKAAKLVKKLRADPNATVRQLAMQAGLRHIEFSKYLKLHGHEDLLKSRDPYDDTFVQDVRKYVKEHPKKSLRSISQKFGISSHTLRRWCPKIKGAAKRYSASEKQAIIDEAISRLTANPELSITKLAKEESFPTFSCLRTWLIKAGRQDLVSRHRKVDCEKAIDAQIIADFEANASFSVAIAAQKYSVAKTTIANKLRVAGQKKFLNRNTKRDYSEFEIGNCYQLGEKVYIATIKCLVTCINGKIIEAIPCRDVYQRLDEMQVKEIVKAWELNSTVQFDRLISPYMSNLYPLAEGTIMPETVPDAA